MLETPKLLRAFLCAAAVLLALSLWLFRLGPSVEVEIPPGAPAGGIGQILRDNGVIASPSLFKVLSKVTRLDRDLKPGVYRLRKNMSSLEALWLVTHGKVLLVKAVIPEGFSARQIAERLEALGLTTAAEFLAYVQANRLEGYLFPTTYYFSRPTPGSELAHRMHEEFLRRIDPVLAEHPQARLTREQAVTLASIIEREAVLPAEKPMIAAVYLNRLARRKPLEADPTVQYALGYWKKNLSLRDLKIDSPYNTYARFGLPPGPICSPGLDSVRSVFEPARTDALYFVADNTGGHTFNASYDEHLKAKARAARARRQKQAEGGLP